jgi:terminase small subunit / prophage DNA-packing protein
MGKIVNKVELSEILGISLKAVDMMIRQGMPVKERGIGGAGGGFKIDVSEAVKWQVESAAKDVSDRLDAVNIDEARLRKIAAEAALAELDLALKRGDAVSLAGVAKRWEGMVTAFKYRCLAIPAKLAPALVAETDLVVARGMLEPEIHEALDALTGYEPRAHA